MVDRRWAETYRTWFSAGMPAVLPPKVLQADTGHASLRGQYGRADTLKRPFMHSFMQEENR